MSLLIHRAERADRLAQELGALLSTPLADAFASEVVAVPTQGVERWLAQTLSHVLGTSPGGRDGVCAGLQFTSPRRLTATAVASVLALDARSDPWSPRRAVWPLLEVLDQARGEPWAALVWSYLGDRPGESESVGPEADPVRRGRRWSTAQHLAELFADYAGSRPEMVRRWRAGQDVDGSGRPLPPELAWQPELWRRLRAVLELPSPAERTEEACAELATRPDTVQLPARLSVFGPTRLSPEHRAVLAALAVHRDVHLWLTHPSPALWDRVAERVVDPGVARTRARDATAELAQHPLLAYLGRDIRELQVTLTGTAATDLHHGRTGTPATTLLGLLQDDLTHDRPLRPPDERPLLAADDRSITLHASHGPDRQVEVLRELLVGLLADDPTLEPRDIVVMCPDIETFAPLISASFGLATDDSRAEHPGHRLRVRLADRALRQVNPLLAALSRVLALVESRVEASALLDLCAFPPVAHKFRFTDDDLERLGDLVVRSGVRWGLDPEHRSSFAMGQFAQNTWAAGLDRLLLGVAMDETGQRYIGTTLPMDDVDSSDVDLVGRLAELVDRLRRLTLQLGHPRPVRDWIGLCQQVVQQLTSVPANDSWQLSHAYAELGRLAQLAADDPGAELSLPELKALLADTFRGRATRANFRTGTLTMCTMMPMRSVPHRVICLLGVDDGVFPRHSARDGDDILAADPWVGDQDPRSEDRQLLLDAIQAAGEHLLVIYSGADERTRATKAPAVPIGALLDTLDVTARTGDGGRVRDQITTRHALQPFDAANFQREGNDQRRLSFDQGSWRGALAAARPRSPAPGTFDLGPVGPLSLPQVVPLADLVRFFNHPVRAFLRARAGLYPGREEEDQPDQIPVRLDGLQAWAIGDLLLRLHLDGTPLEQLRAAEWRRGRLPPRSLGSRTLEPVLGNVSQVAELARPLLEQQRTAVDLQAHTGGHTVTGTLSSLRGERLVTVNYSWLGPKHRLQAWIELLTLTVGRPEGSWHAVTIGRGRRSVLGPVPPGWAAKVLADLVDLYATGLQEPLPLGPKTTAEYARIRREGRSVDNYRDKLGQLWAEDRDPTYDRFFGPGFGIEQLLSAPSRPAEERGSLAEGSRVGTLARRVWHPLLESEVLT